MWCKVPVTFGLSGKLPRLLISGEGWSGVSQNIFHAGSFGLSGKLPRLLISGDGCNEVSQNILNGGDFSMTLASFPMRIAWNGNVIRRGSFLALFWFSIEIYITTHFCLLFSRIFVSFERHPKRLNSTTAPPE
jgi:hypothetical protein